MAALLSLEAIDSLVADAAGLDGAQGLLNQLTKAVLKRVHEWQDQQERDHEFRWVPLMT
ncbi:hypothetical protein [Saccharopolyspora spinosa]|uniref:Mutator family transposase n=1 Tax=Saccharopolyspora spinosa TaxID=60894 RepID=A0A2N3Y6E7_SACSN|nr:hypothetical protein [Saccharopolyspora spinosa]PKW18453.1 hypothetical protein A8926_6536 [Saccharopolyspora spinosa]